MPCCEHSSKCCTFSRVSQFYLHTRHSSTNGMNHTCLCVTCIPSNMFNSPKQEGKHLVYAQNEYSALTHTHTHSTYDNINSTLPGIKNSLICSQLLHKASVRLDTAPFLFHMLIGCIERPALLLHCICYHLFQIH